LRPAREQSPKRPRARTLRRFGLRRITRRASERPRSSCRASRRAVPPSCPP
jgi:hypothetical protein